MGLRSYDLPPSDGLPGPTSRGKCLKGCRLRPGSGLGEAWGKKKGEPPGDPDSPTPSLPLPDARHQAREKTEKTTPKIMAGRPYEAKGKRRNVPGPLLGFVSGLHPLHAVEPEKGKMEASTCPY